MVGNKKFEEFKVSVKGKKPKNLVLTQKMVSQLRRQFKVGQIKFKKKQKIKLKRRKK